MKGYQLKITIKNSKPPIWRRCIVPAGLSFSQLSMVLNEVMGWAGDHLFSFEFNDSELRIEESDVTMSADIFQGKGELLKANDTYIDAFMEKGAGFTYRYDFGDDWQHSVTIEEVVENCEPYPVVLKYKGDCPPEDIGGLWGYYESLEEPEDELKILLDENTYDLEAVNADLAKYFRVTLGKGETRNLAELYEAVYEKEEGLKAAKNPKNKKPSQSSSHRIPETTTLLGGLIREISKPGVNEQAALTAELEPAASLEYIYQYFKKDDVLGIARIHGLPSCTKYNKKNLVTCTADYILRPEIMRRFFVYLRDQEIREFEKAMSAEGSYRLKRKADFHRISEGGYCGWIENDCDCAEVPPDVAEAYRRIATPEFHKERKQKSFVLDCMITAGEFYGVAPLAVIDEMFTKNGREALSEDALAAELMQMPEYFKRFYIHEGLFIHEEFMKELRYKEVAALNEDMPYYIPTIDEIQSLSAEGYLPSLNFERMKKMLSATTGMPDRFAQELTMMIQKQIRDGAELSDIFTYLHSGGIQIEDEEQFEQFAECTMHFWNDTRMFIIRGFKPDELMLGEADSEESQVPEADQPPDDNLLNFQLKKR